MAFLNMNGWKMHYERVGDGTDEVLIFVHGNAASERWWDKIKPLLPGKWSNYFIDLRGFGKSDNKKPYTIQQFTDDIAKFSEMLNLPEFHYVGHSMGGFIGYAFAIKYPWKLKSLILVDAPPATGFPVTDDVRKNFEMMMKDKKLLEMSLRNGVALFLKDEKFFEDVIVRDALRSIPQAYTDTLDAIDASKVNFISDIPKIEIPVLFIHGEKDGVVPWDWMGQTFNAFKNKKESTIKNSSHSPMIENPEDFVESLKEFIEKEVYKQ